MKNAACCLIKMLSALADKYDTFIHGIYCSHMCFCGIDSRYVYIIVISGQRLQMRLLVVELHPLPLYEAQLRAPQRSMAVDFRVEQPHGKIFQFLHECFGVFVRVIFASFRVDMYLD